MEDERKTKAPLIKELPKARQKIPSLKKPGRQETKKGLTREQQLLLRITKTSPVGITVVNRKGQITFANPRAEKVLGLTRKEITRRTYNAPAWSITDYDGRPFPDEQLSFRKIMATGKPVDNIRHAVQWPDGRRVLLLVNASPLFDSSGQLDGMVATIEDVSQQVKLEQELRSSEERFRQIFDHMSSCVAVYQAVNEGEDFIFKDFNRAASEIEKIKKEDLLGKSVCEVFPGVKPFGLFEVFQRVWRTGRPQHHPVGLYKDNRVYGWKENYVFRLPSGDIVAVYDDITESKQAEEALRESEERYRLLFHRTPIGIFHYDGELKITLCNDRLVTILQSSRDRLIGLDMKTLKNQSVLPALVKALEGEEGLYEGFYQATTGTATIWVSLHTAPLFDRQGQVKGGVGIVEDTTDRREARAALERSEARYRNLADSLPQVVFEVDEKGVVIFANAQAFATFGYSPEDFEKGLGAMEMLIEEDRERAWEIVTQELASGKERSGDHYTALRKDGTHFPVMIYATPIFQDQKFSGFRGILIDMTDIKGMERELQNSLDKLRGTIESVVQAMALTVEAKDPYTAGHQRKVAALAQAIAREMDLPLDRVEGLRMAGMIHDLGKISVPSEILSKPNRLTDLEYQLIKVHSQAGYDILKEIDFPWPIAQMVLQHHERLDGSGYPTGLKAQDILLEVRILMVADVVEAMASHRPYRPAEGIEKALEEISQGQGRLYDSEVVEACVRLFREKGFTFN